MRGGRQVMLAGLFLGVAGGCFRSGAKTAAPVEGPMAGVILADNPTPRQWWILGPFVAPLGGSSDAALLDVDFLAPAGGEAGIRLPEGLTASVSRAGGPPLMWKPAAARGDVVDLGAHLAGSGKRVAYAFTVVTADEDATAHLMCAATGSKRVWVNGRSVYRQINQDQAFDKRDSITAVRLRKGENQVLLKLIDGEESPVPTHGDWGPRRGWKFSFTLADPFQSWLYYRSDYGRGRLRLAFTPAEPFDAEPTASSVEPLTAEAPTTRPSTQPASAPDDRKPRGLVKATPPRWVTAPPQGPGIVILRDWDGRGVHRQRCDLAAPIALTFPGPGLFSIEVFGWYADGPGRCGVTCAAVGDLSGLADEWRARALRWLDGPGRKDRRHRGQVLWLAEAAFGRSWRKAETVTVRNPYELMRLRDLLDRVAAGTDVLYSRLGTFQWAFVSSADGTGQPLSISLPADHRPGARYPLVVFLHGSGGTHRTEAMRSSPSAEPYIQISGDWRGPYCRHYGGLAELDITDAVAFMRREYNIDADRTYLFGHSIGAWGSWRLSSRHPDLFAAVAPHAGASRGCLLENLLNVPIRAYQGTADRATPAVYTMLSARRLQSLGGDASVRLYEGAGHWVHGAPGDAVRWLLTRRRVSMPRSVGFATRGVTRGRGRAYWLAVQRLRDPHRLGRVRLTVGEKPPPADEDGARGLNHLAGRVENVELLRLSSLNVLFEASQSLALQINGQHGILTAPLPETITLRFSDDGKYRLLHKGLPIVEPIYSEGSMGNLFDGKPVRIVVPARGDDAYRQSVLAGAEELSRAYGRFGGVPILTDAELDVDQPDAHLILLGSAETNRALRRLVGMLPLRESAGVLFAPGLGRYKTENRGYAFYYHHPMQPKYRVLVFCSRHPDYFRRLHQALPDGIHPDTDTWDAAPDFVLYDVADNRYVRVADLGNDWRFAPAFRTSPRVSAKLAATGELDRCLGEALRQVSGADFAFTSNGRAVRVDPASMRVADLACLARARWGFGVAAAVRVRVGTGHLKYMVGRMYDRKKVGKAFDPFALWPRPARDWSAEDRQWTVCFLENDSVNFNHVSHNQWVNPRDRLAGVDVIEGDFAGALERIAAEAGPPGPSPAKAGSGHAGGKDSRR